MVHLSFDMLCKVAVFVIRTYFCY